MISRTTLLFSVLCTTACTYDQSIGETPSSFAPSRWSISLGSSGVARGTSVAFDGNGDVVASGWFRGVVDFGDQVHDSGGGSAQTSFLTKRARAGGAAIWTVLITAPNLELGDVIFDGDNNVIVVGSYAGAVTFGDVTLHGSTDSFVAKYHANGQLLWAKALGPNSKARLSNVAVTGDNQIYASGSFEGVFVTPTSTIAHEASDGVLVAFSPTGEMRWGRRFDAPLELAATSIDIVATAAISKRMTVDGTTLEPIATRSPVTMRIAETGSVQWQRVLGEAGREEFPTAVAVGLDGRVITVTNTNEREVSPSRSAVDVRSGGGDLLWSTTSVRGRTLALDAAVLPDGTVITAGQVLTATTDLGAGSQAGAMFFQAHDPQGVLLEARTFGTNAVAAESSMNSIAANAAGDLAFTGTLDQPIDFGAGVISPESDTSIVIGVFAQ